jgi:hypothetical protein
LDFWDSSKTFLMKCFSVAHFYLPFHAGVALSTDNSITAKIIDILALSASKSLKFSMFGFLLVRYFVA